MKEEGAEAERAETEEKKGSTDGTTEGREKRGAVVIGADKAGGREECEEEAGREEGVKEEREEVPESEKGKRREVGSKEATNLGTP